ncbi:MAG TPA: hypothetical protein PKO06_03645 [Candidatus Ozemobacteraceae bacterium]|nr:hypothetical protein [Candidatus Ozemobacteraceae bacterium]
MKKPVVPFVPPLRSGTLKGLDSLAGLPPENSKESAADRVVGRLTPAKPFPAVTPTDHSSSREWRIQKHFLSLYDKLGKPFARFLSDLLDILLSGSIQNRLVSELIEARVQEMRREKAEEARESGAMHRKVTPSRPVEVTIGGEPRQIPRHFLKRKSLIAGMLLNTKEFSGFQKLWNALEQVVRTRETEQLLSGLDRPARRKVLEEIVGRLKLEICHEDLVAAWALLEADQFEDLEWAYTETRMLSIVRPAFYEDLDTAYREAKKLLKLLISEFEEVFPPEVAKKDAILDYLREILEVYTHHHFVLKYFNQSRPSLTRKEWESTRQDLLVKIESLKAEALRLRDENRSLLVERDRAVAQMRTAAQQAEESRQQLQKLDPAEVARQRRAMESEMNQLKTELTEAQEEENHLRLQMRKLDAENQSLLQQLRDLKAIPDESAKSVAGMLEGKRVVIFGGVGRDHYLPVLKEAGVKESDFVWYEGYRTISQNRTAEIMGRCDFIVVITSYAGHLHTWQTRSSRTEGQVLEYIHNSGTGTLRQKIIERFGPGDRSDSRS